MYTSIQLIESKISWQSGRKKTVVYFLASVAMYLSLLVINYFHKGEAMKLVANGFALFIFTVFLLKVLLQPTVPRLNMHYAVGFTLIIFGMLCNAIENYGATDMADYLKMILSPLFFFIGYFSLSLGEFRDSERKKLLFFTSVIFLVPALIALGEAAVWGGQFKEGESISIFANRNNAALYALALSPLFIILKIDRRWVGLYLIMVSALFGTLGVFIALMLSIIIVKIRKRNIGTLIIFSMTSLVLVSIMLNLPVFHRLHNLIEGLKYLYSTGQIQYISQMNYGELSKIMGSSDVSFFFRIIHWMELMKIYSSGSLLQVLFGHGVGSSVRETSAALVPHNDYLRYLFECGIFAFTGFLILNLRIAKDIGSTYISVPFVTIIIYFFSENLINNFLAMMLFYFLAGFVIAKTTAMAKQRA